MGPLADGDTSDEQERNGGEGSGDFDRAVLIYASIAMREKRKAMVSDANLTW